MMKWKEPIEDDNPTGWGHDIFSGETDAKP